MKLPNGYGAVHRMGGRRRKPFAVRITTRYAPGEQERHYLGFYATKQEAVEALAEYNKHPYNLDARTMTFAECYGRWVETPQGDPRRHASLFRHLEPLHGMRMSDIRRRHIQGIIDGCEMSKPSQEAIKALASKVFSYAIDMDLLTDNPARGVKVHASAPSAMHKPFTPEEIAMLWQNADDPGARVALALIYTGMRPVELCLIKRGNVHLAERYMVGGVKTAAGRDRVIPLHERITPFIEAWLAGGGEYLYTPGTGGEERRPDLLYNSLLRVWRKGSVTRSVYTHKTIAQLVEAINKLP